MTEFTLPVHVGKLWLIRVTDTAGQVLPPGGFEFYGCAAAPRGGAVGMVARVRGDATELVLPGLCAPGAWDLSIFCREVATGVTWAVQQGRVNVTPAPGLPCGGVVPAVDELVAVLDPVTHVLSVVLGDSTASVAANARLAVAAREGAEAEAARAVDAAAKAEALKGVALDAAAKAALSAEGAEVSKRGAEAAAVDAEADARVAEGKAAEAEASREAAEAAQRQAEAKAAEAEAGAKVATEAVSAALAARDEAAAARDEAVGKAGAAEASRVAAEAAADDASVSRAVANAAQEAAEAAQSRAEEQAAIATAAAEAAQAPESWAVQAARPATMVLLKEELERLLGGSGAFIVDTDGQRLIVHTDRLEDEQLAAVEDMLGRYVPKFLEIQRYNHHIELTYAEYMKYSACKNTSQMYDINPDFNNDVTASGVWAYNLDNLTSINTWNGNRNDVLFKKAGAVKKAYISLPKLKAASDFHRCGMVAEMENLEELEFSAPQSTHFYHHVYKCPKLKRVKLTISPQTEEVCDLFNGCDAVEVFEIIPGLDNVKNANAVCCANSGVKHWSIPLPLAESADWSFSSVDVFDVELPRVTSLYQSFSRARLDKVSALRIINSLPAEPVALDATNTYKGYRPGEAQLGIHVDHKTDADVLDAIERAEERGWRFTIKWNPDGGSYVTPAAATYSMRQPAIYARVGEKPLDDGGVERFLDWGHYVTDPTGYEEFRSVEAAREYFGLPEEDLTETE